MIRRRPFLKRLGISGVAMHIAGCLSVPSTTESSDSPSNQSHSDTTGGEQNTDESHVQRRITLAGQDSVPQEYDAQINVEMLRSTVTPEQTARLRVTTTNTGERRGFSLREGNQCSLFNRDRGGSDSPHGLWLYSPSDTKYLEREGDKWIASNAGPGWGAYGCGGSPLSKNESINNEYVVWDDYRTNDYMSPDVYRFEERVTIFPISQETVSQTSQGMSETREPSTTPTLEPSTTWMPRPTADPRRIEFTWGFSLEVST